MDKSLVIHFWIEYFHNRHFVNKTKKDLKKITNAPSVEFDNNWTWEVERTHEMCTMDYLEIEKDVKYKLYFTHHHCRQLWLMIQQSKIPGA